MIAKYFATSLAIENVVRAPRVISSCLPISTISISLVGFESRSTMLPASRAATVPVFMATPTSACASAGASLVPSLLIANEPQLVFRGRLGEEIVDPGFSRNRGGSHRVVARDHDGADAHASQLGKALTDAALHDILEVNDAEQPAILRHGKRGAAGLGDGVGYCVDFPYLLRTDGRLQCPHGSRRASRSHRGVEEIEDRVDGALAHPRVPGLDAAHPALGGERNKVGVNFCQIAPAHAVLFLGEHHDGSAFGSLVGE